jgi:Spy/CpxP family protein refolding chaperone
MFTLALGGMLALGAATAVYAQDNGAPPPDQQQGQAGGRGHGRGMMDPNRQLEHLTNELSLSADQQSQIKPILVDREQKMQALWQNQSLSREDRRSQMMAIRQDADAKIQGALNDQQKQKYQAMQAERMRGRRGQGQGAPGGAEAPPAGQPQPQ